MDDIVNLDVMRISIEYIKVKFGISFPDFEFFFRITRWADCYSFDHYGVMMTILKDCVGFHISLSGFSHYVKGLKVSVWRPTHRLTYEKEKIEEFKEFISKRFKRYNPTIEFYAPKLGVC